VLLLSLSALLLLEKVAARRAQRTTLNRPIPSKPGGRGSDPVEEDAPLLLLLLGRRPAAERDADSGRPRNPRGGASSLLLLPLLLLLLSPVSLLVSPLLLLSLLAWPS
jgi:hypothetical protein